MLSSQNSRLVMFTSIALVTSVLAAVCAAVLIAAGAFIASQGVARGKWSHHHPMSRDGPRKEDSRDFADPVPAPIEHKPSVKEE